jgi:hypothetical protein
MREVTREIRVLVTVEVTGRRNRESLEGEAVDCVETAVKRGVEAGFDCKESIAFIDAVLYED